MNNCHFEPKARNLEFQFLPVREVLAHRDAAVSEIDDHGNCTGRKGAVREDAHREVPPS
ncbi:MAG TPA: hypothetical protein VKV29_06685 [Chthonomonas sp.]|jgi:hypothetical protein|uniref:hypothetical protein n=1 Tax=Chthonomonas sp. TaxID=2282153 RepID=UPI002B4ACBD3|nr:hypothetical protein [Chthonomonas sp.]HLH79954.1 hypothetical protein [Chthonomonas sp.]